MHKYLALLPIAASLVLVFPGATRADEEKTLSGPGWEVHIDSTAMMDDQAHGDSSAARLSIGIMAGRSQESLMTQFLTAKPWRATFVDAVNASYGTDPLTIAPALRGLVTFANGKIELVADGPTHSIGGPDKDELIGDQRNNWLAGGPHSDSFTAGEGNDVLFIDAKDMQNQIKAGKGMDVAVIVRSADEDQKHGGVTLNLTMAEIEIALGGPLNDVLIGGGRSSVFISGGAGHDLIIGGAANDGLSGDEGDDLIDGGAGSDVIHGGPGNDQLMGGAGDDVLFGGLGADRLAGGNGKDVLFGNEGDDQLDGGDGIDMAGFSGKLSEYRIQALNDKTWRVADTRPGRADADILNNVETLAFSDWQGISLDQSHSFPMDDRIEVSGRRPDRIKIQGNIIPHAYRIDRRQLIANDVGYNLNPQGITFIDIGGNRVPVDTWAPIEAGSIMLTQQGDIIVKRTGTSWLPSFRYRLSDSRSHQGTSALRIPGKELVEITATVSLIDGDKKRDATTVTVECSATCTLSDNQKNLLLTGVGAINGTGNARPNRIDGNVGDNTLDGSLGADVMVGGPGNDIYLVDDPGDLVEEKADEGIDSVWSFVDGYVLPTNVENLTLTPGVLKGSGNNLDNVLIGNAKNNTLLGGPGSDRLVGGAGADLMIGGTGDDIYVVDDSDDRVVEKASEGTDTVSSEISFALPDNVENLVLVGTRDIDGTGNNQDNLLNGNAGNNSLYGGPGNDVLDGGEGDDLLDGGPGNDTYLFRTARGHDTIVENDPTSGKLDKVVLSQGAENWLFTRNGNDLLIRSLAANGSVAIRDWYLGPAHQIEEFDMGKLKLGRCEVETLAASLAKSLGATGQNVITFTDEARKQLSEAYASAQNACK